VTAYLELKTKQREEMVGRLSSGHAAPERRGAILGQRETPKRRAEEGGNNPG